MSKGKWKKYKAQDNNKKHISVGFRLTEQEKAYLDKKAKDYDLNTSEYVVAKCVYPDSANVIALRKELLELSNELIKIGNNLNQSTRALNIFCKNPTTIDKASIASTLTSLEEEKVQTIQLLQKIDTLLSSMKELK